MKLDKRGGEYMDKEGEASKKQSTTEPEIITLQPGILIVLDAR